MRPHTPTAPHRPRPALQRLVALLCGLALATACGSDEAAPGFQRLDLAPTRAAAQRALPTTVLHLEPPVEQDEWTIDADGIQLAEPRPGDLTELPLLSLTRDTSGVAMRLTRRGEYDLASFDHLRLHVACRGGTRIAAALRRGGAVVGISESVSATHQARVSPLDLPFAPQVAERGVAESLEIVFGDTPRAVRLAAVELIHTPPAAQVPWPEDGPRLFEAGGQARRAVGLSTERALQARVVVPDDGALGFGLAQPRTARWLDADPTVVLSLLDPDGAALQEHRIPLPAPEAPGAWSEQRFDLSTFAGQTLDVRFELQTDDERPAACAVAEAAVWSARPDPRPPVLLVTTDTHRGDHLGQARAGVDVATPTLDALAARGLFFEDCFSSVNYTNPSHIALMTGRHPRDIGILTNKQPVSGDAETLAERFRDAGYRTYAALSAHHLADTVSGLGQGFDRMTWPERAERRSDLTLDIVERWLEDDDERPLFLWVHVFDAHRPYDPPKPFLTPYYDGPPDPFDPALPPLAVEGPMPAEMQGLRVLDYPFAQYKALVTYLDAHLARALEHPRFDDAVVAVVGDHGESLGDHGVWFDHAELYLDTLHVPLILAWSGAPAGQRATQPVSHLDLGRTLLDLAGLEAADFPGRSLLGALPSDTPRFALSSHGSSASITVNGLHLILHLRQGHQRYAHHQIELFDLSTDPACAHDLVDSMAGRARALRAQLIDWLGSTSGDSLAGDALDDPALLATLAQLGYTGGDGPSQRDLWQPDDCAWCQRYR